MLISDSDDAADADGPGLPVAKLADAGVARRLRLDADARDRHGRRILYHTPTRVIGTDGYLAGAYPRSDFSLS